MKKIARVGDAISGGDHCHGHNHGPQPGAGKITGGAGKVFVEGRPVARDKDPGHSPTCCIGVGTIVIQAKPDRVFVEGRPVAVKGTRTKHCGMAAGAIQGGSEKVFVR